MPRRSKLEENCEDVMFRQSSEESDSKMKLNWLGKKITDIWILNCTT